MAPEFEALNFEECRQVLSNSGKGIENFDEQLDTNNAFIYYLKGNKVLLISGELNDESQGILYKDYLLFKKHLSQDNFPIKNKIKRVEELYQNEILSLEKNPNYFVDFFNDKFNYNLIEGDFKSLVVLAEIIKAHKSELTQDELFLSCLFIGEIIRKSKNGKWVFLKKYGQFNPYQVPVILFENQRIYFFLDKADIFFISEFSFEKYVDDSLSNYPEITLDGNFILNNYNSYRIIQI